MGATGTSERKPVASAAEIDSQGAEAAYQFALGRLQADEGDTSAAEQALARAVALVPDDPFLRIEYAGLLVRTGQLSRVDSELVRAAELAPDDIDVLHAASEVRMQAADRDPRQLPAAQRALEEVRRRTPADVRSMVALAQLYLAQGRGDDAVAVLREVARYRPGHPMVNALLVDALLKADQPAAAEEVLTQVLTGNPLALESRLQLADLQGRRDDHRAAVATLLAAPEDQRQSPELLRRLGFEQFRLGEGAAALATVDQLLIADPESTAGRYLRGLVLASLGRDQEAETVLSALAAEAPRSIDVAEALAAVLERRGRVQEAADALAAVAARLPASSDAQVSRLRLRRGTLFLRHGQLAEAVAALAELRSAGEPEVRDQALLLEIQALTELTRGDEARELLRAREAREPLSFELRGSKAELLWSAGDRAAAEAELDGLVATGDGDALLLAARVYQQHDEWLRPIGALQQFLASHPDATPIAFALGAAQERSGQRSAAIATFQALLEKAPEFAPALNYLGYMWAEQGENRAEALALVERAVALDPNNGAYLDSLGWAHFQLGQLAEARRHLERAADLVPDDPTVSEHLGDVYRALGDKDRARTTYRRALGQVGVDREQVQHKLDELD